MDYVDAMGTPEDYEPADYSMGLDASLTFEMAPGLTMGFGGPSQGLFVNPDDPTNAECGEPHRSDILRTSWRKWDRARRTFGEFITTLNEVEANGNVLSYEHSDDPVTNTSDVWLVVQEEPLLEALSDLYADYINDLRKALDYAAWSAIEHFTGEEDKAAAFPLALNTRNSNATSRFKRLPNEIRPLIEAVQPYRMHNERDTQCALGLLHEMVSSDKHRQPVACAVLLAESMVRSPGFAVTSTSRLEGKHLEVDRPGRHHVWTVSIEHPGQIANVVYGVRFHIGMRSHFGNCYAARPRFGGPLTAVKRVLSLMGRVCEGEDVGLFR